MSKSKVSLNGIMKDIKKCKPGRYAWGGYVDCPDQEKDPETGKCKAEVVRGREAAAANKAAAADMNAWAKQVAAIDKANAQQDAAQYAGQTSFDYDWMQSQVEKAEKKAAIAQYKQFFQQNPNTFVPDDTSGFSPEQKYIIASKLKQKASTNLGAKAFQQKFNQDPRFYDLQRIQSDIVPIMGGWSGVRNWMFNNKQKGGEFEQTSPYIFTKDQYKKGMDFHTKWLSSPMYNSMINASAPTDARQITDQRKKRLSAVNFKYVNTPNGNVGGDADILGNVSIYPKGIGHNGIGTHEVSHVTDNGPGLNLIPAKDQISILEKAYAKINLPKYQVNKEYVDYINKPTETRARLNQIRQQAFENKLYDPFTEKVSPAIYNKLKRIIIFI